MSYDRLVSAATLRTSKGGFFFHIYMTPRGLYRWDCSTDFTDYSVRSGLFSTYQQALYRADRERCFFAEMWETSEGQGWEFINEKEAA